MKKIEKLFIKTEKLLKSDELKQIKGGDATCYVFDGINLTNEFQCTGASASECQDICNSMGGGYGIACYCY